MKVNGVEVKAGQVWLTRSGRLALIVQTPDGEDVHELGMLWFDGPDGQYTVGKLYARLQQMVSGDPSYFFEASEQQRRKAKA